MPEAIQLTKEERRERMRKAVESLQKYMKGYPDQIGYLDYSDETFIDDMLYGIGVAIDSAEYGYASGYRKFKERVQAHIDKKSGSYR